MTEIGSWRILHCDSKHKGHIVLYIPAYCRSLCIGKNDFLRYCGHSKYCKMRAICTLQFPFFPIPLYDPSVVLKIIFVKYVGRDFFTRKVFIISTNYFHACHHHHYCCTAGVTLLVGFLQYLGEYFGEVTSEWVLSPFFCLLMCKQSGKQGSHFFRLTKSHDFSRYFFSLF